MFRSRRWRHVLQVACLAVLLPAAVAAPRQTVCTITINSADEKAAFARHLPATRFRFVELVQPGQSDWLGAACRAGVQCDVMIVSGHYDGGNAFFADGPPDGPTLSVSELERASCSDACPGLFSRLKQVYLFGCNTLNPTPLSSATAELVRSIVRDREPGVSQGQLAWLGTVHGESSRERMRQVFSEVPVIYGFASMAPLGPVAAATLEQHLRRGGSAEFGQGRPSTSLLAAFAPHGLSVTRGVSEREARQHWDVCQFADPRLADAQLARHIHRLLRRDIDEVGTHLDRLQRLAAALVAPGRQSPALAAALHDIADDFISRLRFLEAAQRTPEAPVRVRMIELARDLGWLTAAEHRQQLGRILADLLGRAEVGIGEINLACSVNSGHALDGTLGRALAAPPAVDDVAHAALQACLGAQPARTRTLAALAGSNDDDVQMARIYLRHRPITDAAELRALATAITRMEPSDAQARAIEALGRHDLSDPAVVAPLVRLLDGTPSGAVQSAVAGVLLRVDRAALPGPEWARSLRERRLPTASGTNLIDALQTRLGSR